MTTAPILREMDDLPRVPVKVASRIWAGATAQSRHVRECEAAGGHRWTSIRVEYPEVSEAVSFCKRCGVRMCGAIVVEDPTSVCVLPMGHSSDKLHRDASNRWREVEKVRSLT